QAPLWGTPRPATFGGSKTRELMARQSRANPATQHWTYIDLVSDSDDPPVPALRVGKLVQVRHRVGPVPRLVQDVHAIRVVDRLRESLAPLVLLKLQV